jgi:polyhydroxyalkanoate synthesis regulator phasin
MSKVITAAKQAWSAKEQITRNIWLAGLGAYDKGYESATNTVNKGQSIFEELVERGRLLEAETTGAINNTKEQIASLTANTAESLQQKMHQTVASVTHIDADTFDTIIKKIEQIEVAVEEAKSRQEAETIAEEKNNVTVVKYAEKAKAEQVKAKSAIVAKISTPAKAVTTTKATPGTKTKAATVTQTKKNTAKKRVKKQAPTER